MVGCKGSKWKSRHRVNVYLSPGMVTAPSFAISRPAIFSLAQNHVLKSIRKNERTKLREKAKNFLVFALKRCCPAVYANLLSNHPAQPYMDPFSASSCYMHSVSTNICRQWHLPRPNIHSNLLPADHRQSRMQRPLVSSPIRQQVLPVDHVPLNGPERDA